MGSGLAGRGCMSLGCVPRPSMGNSHVPVGEHGTSTVILVFAQSQAARCLPGWRGWGLFGKWAVTLVSWGVLLGCVPQPPMGNSHVPVGERGASAVITVFAQSQAARRVPGWRGLGVFGKWAAALTDGGVGHLAACRGLRWAILMCRSGSAALPQPSRFSRKVRRRGAFLVGGVWGCSANGQRPCRMGVYVAWLRDAGFRAQ